MNTLKLSEGRRIICLNWTRRWVFNRILGSREISSDIGVPVTFSFFLNKNVHDIFSSFAFLFYRIYDYDNVTLLTGRFRDVCCLKSERFSRKDGLVHSLYVLRFQQNPMWELEENLVF